MWTVTKAAFRRWQSDNAPRLAAALTFYMIFSLAPTFIIVVAIASSVVGRPAAHRELVAYLRDYLGAANADVVVRVGEAASLEASGPLVIAAGTLVLVLASTAAFSELHSALNKVWRIPAQQSGFPGILYGRLVAFLTVLGLGVLLLVSVAASAVLSFAGRALDGIAVRHGTLLAAADFALSFAVVTLGFAMVYRYVPDGEIAWRDVWIGGLITAALFTAGKTLIGVYLGRLAVQSIYGAAASLVAVLLWMYYSAQIFFFGAEWTRAYAQLGSSTERRASERNRPASDRSHAPRLRP